MNKEYKGCVLAHISPLSVKKIKKMINFEYKFSAHIEEIRAYYDRFVLTEEMVKDYFVLKYREDIRLKMTLLYDNVDVSLFENYFGYKRGEDFFEYIRYSRYAVKYLKDGFCCCTREMYNSLRKSFLKVPTKRKRQMFLSFLRRSIILDFVEPKAVLWFNRDSFKIITDDILKISLVGDTFYSSYKYKIWNYSMKEKNGFGLDNVGYANVNNSFFRVSRFKKIKFRIFNEFKYPN